MSCSPFFRWRNVSSLLLCDSFWRKQSNCVLNFCQVMSFYALQVSSKKIYYIFAEEPDKLFWPRMQEKTFAFVVKWLEQLENREILCVRRPKFLTVSVSPGCKTLKEWRRCLYNNDVISRPFVETNQSTDGRRVLPFRLDTNQLALIWVIVVH